MGKKTAEIARLLGCHRSTISREIKRGSVAQVQDKNGKRTYYQVYFADSGQRVYEENCKNSVYLKLDQCSPRFTEIIPSTKTNYRYIGAGLISIKPIDLPKMVSIRKRSNSKFKVNKKTLGKSIEERPEVINNRSEFGHWEIDLILGKKTKGEAVVMTLVERQTRFALACKPPNKQAETKPSMKLSKNSCLSIQFFLSHKIMALSLVS